MNITTYLKHNYVFLYDYILRLFQNLTQVTFFVFRPKKIYVQLKYRAQSAGSGCGVGECSSR